MKDFRQAQRSDLRPRRLRRSGERGSVIFIIVMGMLLLTSLGAWVVYASGLAASSAGYQRSASQSLYLSELAILSSTAYLAQPGKANEVVQLMEDQIANNAADVCPSIPNQTPADKCKAIGLPEINTELVANGASGFSLLDITAGGSLSPYAATQEGDFRIEVSGFRGASVMGTDETDLGRYRSVNIAAVATVRPTSANLCAGAAGANSAATQVGMRAYSVIGPILK